MSDTNKTDWDKRFMNLAVHVSMWSKDPSTKVGCVLVNQDNILVGLGYNGFPRNVPDEIEAYEDRARKYLLVQHAEANAVLNCSGNTKGATAYVTQPTCSSCAGLLIQAGIKRIVTTKASDGLKERFKDSFEQSAWMFESVGMDYMEIVL